MFGVRQQSVNVTRESLLEALKKGRIEHATQYVEAVQDYEMAVVKFLEDALNRAKSGDFNKLILTLPCPKNHDDEYDQLIDMLELSVDENINLDSSSFKAYFKGEWDWKNNFVNDMSSLKTYLSQ